MTQVIQNVGVAQRIEQARPKGKTGGSIPLTDANMKIVLASASAGRKKLLENLGLKFEVIPANIDEEKFAASTPLGLVKKIAKAKALAVEARILPIHTNTTNTTNYLIIAADSMVVFKGQTYGKPKSRNEAKRLLKMFSGKSHFFISGLCVLDTNIHKLYQTSGISRVTFSNLTEKEIETYVKTASVTSYAGGYAPDLKGGEIIKAKMKIIGSESNVLGGIPLEKLVPILKTDFNIPVFLPEQK